MPMPEGADEVPLAAQARVVGRELRRVGDVVRHRVGDVGRGASRSVGRLGHRLPVRRSRRWPPCRPRSRRPPRRARTSAASAAGGRGASRAQERPSRRSRRVGIGYGALRSVRRLEQAGDRGSCDGLRHGRHRVHRRARGTSLRPRRYGPVRVTYRDEARLERLGDARGRARQGRRPRPRRAAAGLSRAARSSSTPPAWSPRGRPSGLAGERAGARGSRSRRRRPRACGAWS